MFSCPIPALPIFVHTFSARPPSRRWRRLPRRRRRLRGRPLSRRPSRAPFMPSFSCPNPALPIFDQPFCARPPLQRWRRLPRRRRRLPGRPLSRRPNRAPFMPSHPSCSLVPSPSFPIVVQPFCARPSRRRRRRLPRRRPRLRGRPLSRRPSRSPFMPSHPSCSLAPNPALPILFVRGPGGGGGGGCRGGGDGCETAR